MDCSCFVGSGSGRLGWPGVGERVGEGRKFTRPIFGHPPTLVTRFIHANLGHPWPPLLNYKGGSYSTFWLEFLYFPFLLSQPGRLSHFRYPHFICQPYRRPAAAAIARNELHKVERVDETHLQRKRLRETAEEQLQKDGKSVSKNKLKKLMR